jgi:hypothetical protein
MRVHFHREAQRGGYAALIHRTDGVTVRLPGAGRKWRVPHDLAHLVAERELGLASGVFGCIAAGAMFSNMTLVEGRPRYDARARSRAVLRANSAGLTLAECLSGVVHDAVEHDLDLATAYRRLREAWGVLRPEPCPYGTAQLRRAVDVLTQLAVRWEALAPGEVLPLRWELPAPVPAAPARRTPVMRPDRPG